jgi:succinoglycan biosynthesis protein ExoO
LPEAQPIDDPAHAPLVSVVMPCWNAEGWAGDAVRACLAQTGVSLELLAVDDASTDGTPALLRALAEADPRVRVLTAAVNGGPSRARNLGVAAARGRWIAFVDSDDLMLAGRLERLVRLGEAAGADVLADQQLVTDYPATSGGVPACAPMGASETAPVGLADYLRLAVEGRGRSVQGPLMCSFGQLKPFVRRDFLVRTGLEHDPRFRNGEDLHFHIRCLAAGARMLFVNPPGYLYRRRPSSISFGDPAPYARLVEVTQDLMALGLEGERLRRLRVLAGFFRARADYESLTRALRSRRYVAAPRLMLRVGPRGLLKFLSTPVRRLLRRLRPRRLA